MMSPLHSVGYCPVCGAGLCGVRICQSDRPHGIIVCDECEAIWLQPDLASEHQYANAEDARCPVCQQPLWGSSARWANREDLQTLGWQDHVDRELSGE